MPPKRNTYWFYPVKSCDMQRKPHSFKALNFSKRCLLVVTWWFYHPSLIQGRNGMDWKIIDVWFETTKVCLVIPHPNIQK